MLVAEDHNMQLQGIDQTLGVPLIWARHLLPGLQQYWLSDPTKLKKDVCSLQNVCQRSCMCVCAYVHGYMNANPVNLGGFVC